MRTLLIPTILLVFAAAAPAQTPDSTGAIPRFLFEYSGLSLQGAARSGVYIGDQGRAAAVLGDESGALEVWTWPLKLIRDLRLDFKTPEYDLPIEGARVARTVTARPEGFTIVYSHASFTVRQHVFVPLTEPGVIMLLEVQSVRPLDVLVRMHADFNLAWPGSLGGGYITWQPESKRFLLSQGGVRHYNAFVGSPFATSGTTHPAHDAPTLPSQFRLHFDASTAATSYIPIVAAGGAAPRDSVALVYDRLLRDAPRLWREKVAHYRRVASDLLSVATPDARIDQMLEWSKVNLDQQLVCNPDLGCGLVAGFGRGGAGNFRPGFGWYFGGDAAINSFAMAALGQFDAVRRGLQFLATYQRADGKIAHEISHAAKRLPWFTEYPYTWYHGDTTPFWVLACFEYWLASGDEAFLREQWPNIVRAFDWSARTDANGDGLMENPLAGAGAVEVGGLGDGLLTDIYLAGVWTASLDGMVQMAAAMKDAPTRTRAAELAARAQQTLDNAFWLESAGIYAFALLQSEAGKAPRINDALTVWPATAMSFGLLDATRAERMLREIGSSAITADWGARMLARGHPLYDPLHYNNGTVWPFVTGFAALAHYRYHRGWAGFDLVRDVARASFDFARGRTPELLSGEYYQTLDTSVPQQFFATSMFVSPFVRGTLGWQADAPHRAAAFEPHLPAEWSSLKAANLRVGRDRIEATITREAGLYSVHLRRLTAGAPLSLRVAPALPLGARVERVVVDDRDITVQAEESAHDVHGVAEISLVRDAQIDFHYDGGLEVIAPAEPLSVGDVSSALRVLDFRRDARDYVIVLEGVAGRSYVLQLRPEGRLRAVVGADSFEQTPDRVTVRLTMPPGSGYVRKTLRAR